MGKRKAFALLVTLIMALGTFIPIAGAEYLTATVPVTEDAFIAELTPDEAKGSTDPNRLLVTMNKGPNPAGSRRDGLLKFDLSDINYAVIISAKLKMYVTRADNSGIRIINIYPADANWSESQVTWNTAPGYEETAIGSFSVPNPTNGVWFEADITDYCMNATSKVFSFRLISDTAATYFASKEGDSANAPVLEVRYSTEPVTRGDVTINYVDSEGNPLAPSTTITGVLTGEYTYTGTPPQSITVGEDIYVYDSENTDLTITVTEEGPNIINIIYKKLEESDLISSVIAEQGAYCWFADPRALRNVNPVTGSDKTYVGYIDVYGNIKAVQYDNKTNEYKTVLIRSGFQTDDHDNPTFLVLPDGRVMIFYSEHTSEPCFYYRISKNPDDITELGEEKIIDTTGYGNTTYPSPFIMSDQPGYFYLFWRGVNWHPTIAKFTLPDENDDVSYVEYPKQIVDSRISDSDTGKRPYAKYESNGKDRVYIAFTYTHPDNVSPNSLYYAYIDTNTYDLYDIAGNWLTNVLTQPYKLTNSETDPALLIDREDSMRDWVWQTAIDKDGNPVVLMVRISNAKDAHTYYYAKWTGTEWRKTYLADAGRWFHQNPNGAEKCYSGGLTLDQNDPSIVYASIPVNGAFGKVYEIYKFVIDENGNIVEQTPVTENSQKNNVRPFVVRNATPDNKIYLIWMYGDYYYWDNSLGYPGYPTSIKTASEVTVDHNVDYEELTLGEDVDINAVTSDLTLPTLTINGGKVTWSSSDPSIISNTGVVNRRTLSDTKVTLTATITFSNEVLTKTFEVNVLKVDVEEDLAALDLGDINAVVRDLILPSRSKGGGIITWRSGNTSVLTNDGAIIRPENEPVQATLIASVAYSDQTVEKTFDLTIMPKTYISKNLVIRYRFDDSDVYTDERGQKYIKDVSGNGNDARFMGTSGRISGGVLDLTANAKSSSGAPLAENSYLLAPDGIAKTIRSYTFFARIKISDTYSLFRVYDFGCGPGNSVFLRTGGPLAAGLKYNGQTTQLVTVPSGLTANTWQNVAVTFDAATNTTSVYVNGVKVSSGTNIVMEPFELIGENTRNYIGRTQWWDTSVTGDNPDLNGYIDEFRLYSTALRETDIAELSNPEISASAVLIKNTVSAAISGNVAADKTVTFIVAVYDGSGLVEMKSRAVTIPVASGAATADVELESDPEGKTVKAFVWDGIPSMKPFAQPIQLQ